MPYTKVGFTVQPRSTYIPQYSEDILNALGDKFDLKNAEIIKSLGRENINLKNFVFERLLTFKHPDLDSNPELKMKYIIVMADYLHGIGYISESPTLIDYRIDPVLTADELLDRMLGARMPKFSASELGGEWGTIDHLMMFFSEVIRRNALILQERDNLANRFRKWLGAIGHKLLVRDGELSQAEKSMLVVYSKTLPNYKGAIKGKPMTPIPAVETKEPLVLEAGALAISASLNGPSTAHMKLLSNGILEHLFYYYGHHVAELKTAIGYAQPRGPFAFYQMNQTDALTWAPEAQLIGLSSTSANFLVKPNVQGAFAPRIPFGRVIRNDMGVLCLYPDAPEIRLTLTEPGDISKFNFTYNSQWRGRAIYSINEGGGAIDNWLADTAINNKASGGSQVEMADLMNVGLATFTDAARTKIIDVTEGIKEQYILPSEDGLAYVDIDMSAFYARFGNVQMLPAFSEFLELDQSWFLQPVANVVDYVAAFMNLTLEERVRYSRVIEICHNCARYTRLTQAASLPFDRDQLILVILNKPGITIKRT